MYVLHHDNLKRAELVHRQIPEFDPVYIQKRYATKDIGSKNPYVIVCRHNDTDIGYMIGYDTPDSLYLWLNGTVPKFRQKGAFRSMLNDLIEEARRRGYDRITVKSYERFDAMLHALASHGFSRVGKEGSSILLEKTI